MSNVIPTKQVLVAVSVNSELSEGYLHIGLNEHLINHINDAHKNKKSHIALTHLDNSIELIPLAIASILLKE